MGTRGHEVVVVTGATSGVGRAVAREFARHGASVALLARARDELDGAAADVERLGGRPLPVAVDVADHDRVEAAAGVAERTLGPIDAWINNAMTSVFAPVWAVDGEEFRRVMDVNYMGVVNGTLAALRRMRARGRGTIVQVGSALAYRSIPLQAAYCASKHAERGFTESLRTELLHERSRVWVTMVQLPALNTPQFDHVESKLPRRAQPVPPIYQPEVAARAIHWAAHHRRREVWVGGITTATILANRVAPGLLDHYLARTGFDSQQTDEPEDPARPDNLWRTVPGDPGAHGRFDERAHPRSLQVWASTHRRWLGVGALLASVAGMAAARGDGG